MKEKTNLPVKLNEVIEQSNITDLTKAEKLAAGYAPFMNEVHEQMQLLKKLKKGNEDDLEKAKRIRIDLGKICSKATDQKKIDKDMLLLETRFIDNLFKVVEGAARLTQSEAKEIETYFEEIEKQRLEKLGEDRLKEITPFLDKNSPEPVDLGYMAEGIWNNYLIGAKASHEMRVAAEKKAEEERVAKEKAEAEDRERIKKENEKLKKEREEKEKQLELERIEREKKEAIERKEREEKERKIKEQHEAQLKKEREEKEKIEAELRAKAKAEQERLEAEAKAKADKEAKEQAELSKGDAAKVKDLINDLEELKTKYSFKSVKNQKMKKGVNELIDKIINYID